MLKVYFICHSCFAVELERSVLIFDYYGEGRLPAFPPEKQIYFLASHSHRDHYNRKILTCRTDLSGAEYLLSGDIRLRPEEKQEWIHSIGSGAEDTIGPLRVKALQSTDRGVAFIVETEDVRIYHAGDLNWWHWKEESEEWNKNMAAKYQNEIDKLAGWHFDLAFVVLDPRLGDAYHWGMDYYLSRTDNDHVFPMHCWKDYEVCARYEKAMDKQNGRRGVKDFHKVEYEGQEWELERRV